MELRRRGFGSQFWSLICAAFLGFLGIGTVLPALAPHVRYALGGSDQTVGWVVGTFSLVALGSRFFSGPLADRKGRKIAFLLGLLSCAAAGVAYFLPLGLPVIYLGRALQGFGEACLYTAAAAWAVELGGVERSSQALGFLSSAIWGGISAGPPVGHWLGSFQHAAALQIVTALCAFTLAAFTREDFQPALRVTRPGIFDKSLLVPGFALGFVNVHYPVIAGFLILHLAQHGNRGPAAFSTYAAVILLSRFFLGSLPDRIHPSITFYAGIFAMAIGLVLIAWAPSPALDIAAAGILGLGFSFPWSSVASTVLREIPVTEHGSAIGFLSAFYDLFVGLSSLAAGAIANRFGYSSAFLMAASALVAAAIFGRFVFFGKTRGKTAVEDEAYEPALP